MSGVRTCAVKLDWQRAVDGKLDPAGGAQVHSRAQIDSTHEQNPRGIVSENGLGTQAQGSGRIRAQHGLKLNAARYPRSGRSEKQMMAVAGCHLGGAMRVDTQVDCSNHLIRQRQPWSRHSSGTIDELSRSPINPELEERVIAQVHTTTQLSRPFHTRRNGRCAKRLLLKDSQDNL